METYNNLEEQNYSIKASKHNEKVFFVIEQDEDGQAEIDWRLFEKTGKQGYLRGVLENLAVLSQQRLHSQIDVLVRKKGGGTKKIGELNAKQQPKITRWS